MTNVACAHFAIRAPGRYAGTCCPRIKPPIPCKSDGSIFVNPSGRIVVPMGKLHGGAFPRKLDVKCHDTQFGCPPAIRLYEIAKVLLFSKEVCFLSAPAPGFGNCSGYPPPDVHRHPARPDRRDRFRKTEHKNATARKTQSRRFDSSLPLPPPGIN